ncbi:MAG: hypothetical protein HON32_05900 [Francisellaceae bacterium]|nr:hypothetical protein [Francisellaceae bacterium]MBT6539917.1 hypothetical protein [Francisellaceae bacterium]
MSKWFKIIFISLALSPQLLVAGSSRAEEWIANNGSGFFANVNNGGYKLNKDTLLGYVASYFTPQQVLNFAFKGPDGKIPGWLQRTDIEYTHNTFGRIKAGSITMVQPLWRPQDGILFTQARLGLVSKLNDSQLRTTLNLGIGYRHFFYDDRVLVGVNTFHDWQMPAKHRRYSLGFDIKSSVFDITGNYYVPRSKLIYITPTITERAVQGYDIEAGVALPYLPWTRVYAKKYRWKGYQIAATQGHTFSLQATPFNCLQLEAGVSNDKTSNGTSFVKVAFSYGFSQAPDDGIWIENEAYGFTSMRSRELEKVRRENNIVIERRGDTTGGVSVSIVRIG